MPTAIQESLQALLALQQIDTQILRATKTLAALDTGAQAAADAQAAQQAYQHRLQESHQAAAQLKDNELKSSALEAKRESYRKKLYEGKVTSARELSNMEREIEALGRQISDLDGRILESMDLAESSQAQAAQAQANLSNAEQRRAETAAAYQERSSGLRAELANLTRQRETALSQVPDTALLKRYEEIRAKAGGIGLARIEDHTYGGCHVSLPSAVITAVRDGLVVQTCENCRRLLTQ